MYGNAAEVTISDLVEVNPRTRLPGGVACSFIGMEDVSERAEVVRQNTRNSRDSWGYTSFREGDVLFAKITPCMENGKGAHLERLTGGCGFGSTEFHVLRARRGVEPGYVARLATWRPVRNAAASSMTGSAGQRRVPASFFSTFRVPWLPVHEQKSLVDVLDAVDERIRAQERLVAKLEEVKKSLVRDLFPEEHPPGWRFVPLASLAESITSGSRSWAACYADTGPLFLRIGNLTRRHINLRFDGVSHVQPPPGSEPRRTAVRTGDLLISITADLGVIGVAPDGLGEAYVNQHVALVRPVGGQVHGRWIGHYLTSPGAQAQFASLNDSGAKAGINLPAVGRLAVAMPGSASTQEKTVAVLDHHDRLIRDYERSLAKFRDLERGLRYDLLTGRVRAAEAVARSGSLVARGRRYE